MRPLFNTAFVLVLATTAAAAQSAMPTQTQIPQTAMPDPNQNVVPSDFGIWPASRAPVNRNAPVYHYVRPLPPPPPPHTTPPAR
jgi:hypothetical protein